MNAKTNLLSLLFVSCSLFLLSSCEKEVYNPSKVDKTTDLVVPEGFDWALTRGVTISMESPKQTWASIYLDEACQSLVAELPVKAGQSTISLEVPTANSNLWIQFPTQDGKKEVIKVGLKKEAQTRGQWTADVLFPDRAKEEVGNVEPSYYLPEKDKFGTIMFEDMWPALGDYDFNDYVVNYNIRSWFKQSEVTGDKLDYIYVTMKFKLRAMGGSLPYRFCIQLGNKTNYDRPAIFPPNTVELQDLEITNNDNIGGNVEILSGTKSAIIAFTGFEKLKNQSGGSFYNTELSHLNGRNKYPTVSFTLKIHVNSNDLNIFRSFGGEFAFDYFLQHTENNREIHFIDYPPTELYTEGYKKDLNNKNEDVYYCSDKRFVWALKAPVEMGWSVESKDIAIVYPEFAEWVRRGGDWLEGDSNVNSIREWYNRPTRDKDLYIDCNNH